jgi:hypothetical protein
LLLGELDLGVVVSWSGWVMAGYLLIGAADCFESLIFRSAFGLFGGFIPMANTMVGMRAGRRERIGRLRDALLMVLEVLPTIVTWPVLHLAFRRRWDVKTVVKLRLRLPLEVIQGVWLSLLSVIVAVLVELTSSNVFIRAASYAIIAATIIIPGRWVIDGASLQQELRTTLRNPIIQFAIVAIANFIALSIAASVLLQVTAGSGFRWEAIWTEALQVWKLGHLSAVWKARPKRVAQIAVAIGALAAYALLISQLSRPWLFARKDSDRIEISIRLLLGEDIDDAGAGSKL